MYFISHKNAAMPFGVYIFTDNQINKLKETKTLEVLREHRPPPNASIIELLDDFAMKIAMQL